MYSETKQTIIFVPLPMNVYSCDSINNNNALCMNKKLTGISHASVNVPVAGKLIPVVFDFFVASGCVLLLPHLPLPPQGGVGPSKKHR